MSLVRRLVPALVGAAVSLSATAQTDSLRFHGVFQDHAVLQRDVPVRVWGLAPAHQPVVVELAEQSVQTRADGSGTWSAELPALPAGGPHTLRARSGGQTRAVEDVLVGDVFLCSGQSNMAFQVRATRNASAMTRSAQDGTIRMMTVPLVSDPFPQAELPDSATWEAASPETVESWSAVCYFFAREVKQAAGGVPIGLINSSWGGSNIRAWMDAEALRSVGGHEDALDALALYTQDEPAAQQVFGRMWEAWWHRQTDGAVEEPWQPSTGAAWAEAPAGLGDWTAWDGLQGFTGMLWFRTTVDLTAEQAAAGAALDLGAVDEVDETWINGEVVGNTFGYGTERTYAVPAGVLQEGENVIVVNVLNTWATGGLIGDHDLRALRLDDGTRVPLTDWQYLPVDPSVGQPPRAPWESVAGLSTIYNAMVAPLGDLPLRGVLWYQGESNTGEAATYRAELDALVAQWRRQFSGGPDGDRLPALVVQLPNFGAPPTAPTASGWAEVREAMRLVARDDAQVGLAVTVDLGEVADIHPVQKLEIGRRLARAARRVVYGEEVAPSGPVPLGAERRGDEVVVTFEDVTDGLVVRGDSRPIGFELCGDGAASCRYVVARAEGDAVAIPLDGRAASRVRYAWADSPIVNLYDGSGVPVGPFEVSF